jgi:cytochrome c oxidase assembly protein subunit 11
MKKSLGWILAVLVILMIGMSYAAVPAYRIFCQLTGFGGTTQVNDGIEENLDITTNTRYITINFNADVSSSMPWKFHPMQKSMKVMVGESSLAFYEAENPTDDTIIGVSTYNVTPAQAGPYFNKIQCFCFEEQRLKPHESIDMPVFFFLDPDLLEDPKMDEIDSITLSYTFFKVSEE